MSLTPRSWRNTGIAAAAVAPWASAATSAFAMPVDYQLGFQLANSPVMDQIENLATELLYIITAVCLFVLHAILHRHQVPCRSANPTLSKVHHNTLLEVVNSSFR